MHHEQRERTHDLLKSKNIDRALFANFASVKWLTGFAPPVHLGPNFFLGGPPLVWYEDGHFTLIVLDGHAGAAAGFGDQLNCTLETYLGYTIEQPIAGADYLGAKLREVVGKSAARSGKIGVEERDLTVFLRSQLQSVLPDAQWTPVDGWLEPLRAVKTAEELEKLRAAFALTDVAHEAARQAVQVGRREVEVWTAIHAAVEHAAGKLVPLGNDCTVGRRSHLGGPPTAAVIEPQDSFVADLSTIVDGYWSDSCGTYYATEPTPQQAAMHRTVLEALELAISLVRPGAVAREIDQRVRQFIADAGYPVYPHHTGHGVGVTGHEAPRIVPYNTEVLEKGMVILLEPGIYFPEETGVRLEDAVLVTADGVEVLTQHDKSLPV